MFRKYRLVGWTSRREWSRTYLPLTNCSNTRIPIQWQPLFDSDCELRHLLHWDAEQHDTEPLPEQIAMMPQGMVNSNGSSCGACCVCLVGVYYTHPAATAAASQPSKARTLYFNTRLVTT